MSTSTAASGVENVIWAGGFAAASDFDCPMAEERFRAELIIANTGIRSVRLIVLAFPAHCLAFHLFPTSDVHRRSVRRREILHRRSWMSRVSCWPVPNWRFRR